MSSNGTTPYIIVALFVTYSSIDFPCLPTYQKLEVVPAESLFEIVIDEKEHGQEVAVRRLKRLPIDADIVGSFKYHSKVSENC